MALKKGDRVNFNTLVRACKEGCLTLVESQDTATGEYRAVLAAVVKDGDDYVITPFGHLCTDNPFEQYADPVSLLDSPTSK